MGQTIQLDVALGIGFSETNQATISNDVEFPDAFPGGNFPNLFGVDVTPDGEFLVTVNGQTAAGVMSYRIASDGSLTAVGQAPPQHVLADPA